MKFCESFINAFLEHTKKHPKRLGHFGLEKESLRAANQKISEKPHPSFLGSPLTNPFVTLDFAQAQIEMVTPIYGRSGSALEFLLNLHHFFYSRENDELLWPSSMPPILPDHSEDILIANFGSSEPAHKKNLYRKGLSKRYGSQMQTIAGVHYNFSLPSTFWQIFHKKSHCGDSRQTFISASYLHIIRNFLREGWILSYLFGASPACDASYQTESLTPFAKHSILEKDATSLRMSYHGYYVKVQEQLSISYNNFSQYLKDLSHALKTVHHQFHKMGVLQDGLEVQLNDRYLQIENEHYARIRPKRASSGKETGFDALKKHGIEYLEVRAIDLNPLVPAGIDLKTSDFLHLFLLYCLAKSSPPIYVSEREELCSNQHIVAMQGRKKGLHLAHKGQKVSLESWASDIVHQMSLLANRLHLNEYFAIALNDAKEKIAHAQQTPSGIIAQKMIHEGLEFSILHRQLAEQLRKFFVESHPMPTRFIPYFSKIVEQSVVKEKQIIEREKIYVKGFEHLELSTQILIREALKRNILVTILDASESFIRLTKGSIVQYVKQATRTCKDSYIAALIMENKHVTKQILAEHQIRTPKGVFFTSIDEALQGYCRMAKCKVVVKPTNSNYGEGISFVEADQEKIFEKAILEAFKHDHSILIEEFVSGHEYRFLVMGQRVIGVLLRDPANVIGDGLHSIAELITIKNHSPKSYVREHKDLIKLGVTEKEFIKKQGLTARSVLPKGKKVYLRQNSNVSTGGDAIDVTDEIHPGYKTLAIEATNACTAQISGVDMMILDDQSEPAAANYAVIEMNFNPAIAMHRYPDFGSPRDVGREILDFLGF